MNSEPTFDQAITHKKFLLRSKHRSLSEDLERIALNLEVNPAKMKDNIGAMLNYMTEMFELIRNSDELTQEHIISLFSSLKRLRLTVMRYGSYPAVKELLGDSYLELYWTSGQLIRLILPVEDEEA